MEGIGDFGEGCREVWDEKGGKGSEEELDESWGKSTSSGHGHDDDFTGKR